MELERAFKLLKLSSNCSLEKLNESFRKLAKVYHPDSNKGREKWAHRTMTELNLAYEKVLDFITTPVKEAKEEKPLSGVSKFSILFNRTIQKVLEGIYTYYQYGLENARLRYEGVRKFRYRDALRYIRDGIRSLEDLQKLPKTQAASVKLQIFSDFSKAFLQNMLIEKLFVPTNTASEKKAFFHYYNGSDHLDYAIKDAFFGDELIQVRSGTYSEKMHLSREELMLVISRYFESDCVSEALLKIYLLEVFTKVVQLLHRMRY
jgi:hypothetical protein